MFSVYDHGKLAQYPDAAGPSWDNATFPTFLEAEAYARRWLGAYSKPIRVFELGVEVDYSGYGDMIVIKET